MAKVNYNRINFLKEKHEKELIALNKKNELDVSILKKTFQFEIDRLEKENESLGMKNRVLEELKHDIARFSMETLSSAEELNLMLNDTSSIDKDKIGYVTSTIIHSLSMISPRIVYSDMELSNGQVNLGAKFNAGVYKKFDKASKVLKRKALKKHIKITFCGNSKKTIKALNSFDIVPFVVLDNAIKYSPRDSVINVSFDEMTENGRILDVIVSSIGPYVDECELKKLTERGFRSKNKIVSKTDGLGLGLYIAKNICTYHGIGMNFQSTSSFSIDDSEYGEFVVKFSFS